MITSDIHPSHRPSDLPPATTEARANIADILDSHHWVVHAPQGHIVTSLGSRGDRTVLPATPEQCRRCWGHICQLELRLSMARPPGDRIAQLAELRLKTFRIHWEQPPTEHNYTRFITDVTWLIPHDLPRIRQLLSGINPTRAAHRSPSEPSWKGHAS